MTRVHLARTIALHALIANLFGCDGSLPRAEASPATVTLPKGPSGAPDASSDRPNPYPHGAWRQADPEILAHTVIWLSHILIRHDESSSTEVSFTLTDWQSTQPHVSRTRREALALAEWLAATAREQGHFDALGRQFSEDPESGIRGGSLGGMIARHLAAFPEVLDAISALRPGDVSRVVASRYGYHVLYRRAPPAEITVSGEHIVIAHDQAPWIRMVARGPVPRRTRREALAIARHVFALAHDAPTDFARLANEYSEHRDATRGGDFGTWSSREPTGYPREIETLSQLEVGEVAEPIDTMFGYQIILRTPNRDRARFAMEEIQLPFDPSQPDSQPSSRARAYLRGQALLGMLAEDPARFRSFQEQECCVGVREVIQGRGLPDLESALEGLSAGQIAREPIEDVAVRYVIPKRLELAALAESPMPRFELPVLEPADTP